ncbi:MAG: hypothetical protein KCHDKBKB_02951 [Elusimicrobia bacterium]|nr:hypothetical protein [Elusimicrobiota bacterium]
MKSTRNIYIFLLAGVVLLPLLSSCKKKDRLSASTYTFSITPPAATVAITESLTLTARGPGDIAPTWTVSDAALGSISPSIGAEVVFTPTGLGDVVITAESDGLQSQSQIAIVTYKPSANTFDVYTDVLATGSGILADIIVDTNATVNFSLSEQSSGYTPQGTKYQRTTGLSTNEFWGVTLDKNNAGLSKDLSAFSAGSLKFSLRLGRTMANPETLRIEITAKGSNAVGYSMVRGTDYSGLSTDWQQVSLPLSSKFPGMDLVHIKVPFAVVGVSLSGTLSFDIDAIRWEK